MVRALRGERPEAFGTEILWRWGSYLDAGEIDQEAGDHTVALHHRPLGDLLTAAADAGWRLDRAIEHGPSAVTRARYPDYFGQAHVPALLGISWTEQTDVVQAQWSPV